MPAYRRPTLADVAAEVGVSAKTVSRVLNGDGPVAPATRERVLAAVRRLGFQPNLMARHIRLGGRDSAIGLIVPDLANPFFATAVSGIQAAIRDRDLTLLMGSCAEDPERERALAGTFLARQVSALLVVPPHGADHGYLRPERAMGLPVVFLDRPGVGLAADSVVSTNQDGAREGTAHLVAHGHRRVAFIGDSPALWTRRARLRGYREALTAAQLPYDRALVRVGHDLATAARAVEALLALPSPPSAVLAGNNVAAMGAVLALTRAHRKDIALVAFDDIPLAEALDPPLTVVAQDPAAIGATAVRIALSRLDGNRTRAHTTQIPTRLIPRGSGELPPPT
jgi:LacI family transcriptional regulator